MSFATQSTWTGTAQDYHFPLISNNALIAGSRFHELNLHLDNFIIETISVLQDGSSENVIKIKH